MSDKAGVSDNGAMVKKPAHLSTLIFGGGRQGKKTRDNGQLGILIFPCGCSPEGKKSIKYLEEYREQRSSSLASSLGHWEKLPRGANLEGDHM